ncbi:MAG TPA: peptide-methionine (S)-S-oxide reductase MsrA [Sulfurimonas sp.]|nr:peptide-methionine (S)-S-oxide reductase MsrA [Sulfurimonas sp.]
MKKLTLILLLLLSNAFSQEKTASFAGGCFWCMEAAFEPVKGVISAESGYMGGEANTANYKEVSQGRSGHYEVVHVRYDNSIISYEELINIFWKNIDPVDAKGQFYDKGQQYKTVIFYQNRQEKAWAIKSKKALNDLGRFSKEIATQIKPAKEFFKAEAYHQDYFKKNSLRYKMYKNASGREKYLKKAWE